MAGYIVTAVFVFAYWFGFIGAYAEHLKHKRLNIYPVLVWPMFLFISLGAWAIHFDQACNTRKPPVDEDDGP